MSYETIDSELKYEGKVLSVYSDKVTMPNGNIAERESVIRGAAAAVIAVDEKGDIYFVRQYRHAVKGFALEIPAGMVEPGEDPKTSAGRELEEETGLKCEQLRFINKMYMSSGFSKEVLYFYVATGLKKGVQHLDENELSLIHIWR